jgi:hypothetical protein
MATSSGSKRTRNAEQNRGNTKAGDVLPIRELRLFVTLLARRQKMSAERRACGNATEGRVCSKCRPPKPALLIDETVDQLLRIGKFRTGFKEDYTNFAINFFTPIIERCGCPFFVVNEFLYHGFISGTDTQYVLLKDYRSINSKLAKELKRSINAIRGCLRGSIDSLVQIEMLSSTGVVSRPEHMWSVMQAVNKLDELLPKVRDAAKYRAGPAGVLIRRSAFLSMAMAWEELTGHLPAKNNVKFQNLANAAYVTVMPNGDKNYSAEAAAATAIKTLKRSNKDPAESRLATQRWLPKSSFEI